MNTILKYKIIILTIGIFIGYCVKAYITDTNLVVCNTCNTAIYQKNSRIYNSNSVCLDCYMFNRITDNYK